MKKRGSSCLESQEDTNDFILLGKQIGLLSQTVSTLQQGQLEMLQIIRNLTNIQQNQINTEQISSPNLIPIVQSPR